MTASPLQTKGAATMEERVLRRCQGFVWRRVVAGSGQEEPMTRFRWIALVAGFMLLVSSVGQAEAAPKKMKAQPWEFVGTAEECGVAGEDTVDAQWIAAEGMPGGDNGNQALYLQKLGTTSNCAAAGATITGVEDLTGVLKLGYDIRDDGHCGAGAPRFNVYTNVTTYFLGCASGAGAPAGGWISVDHVLELGPDEVVQGIDILFDEGEDAGAGYAYLDNIYVNDSVMGKPGTA
jgi:hypothetical protein